MASTVTPEFPRPIDLRQIGNAPIEIEADAAERARLAGRFGIAAIDSLTASVSLEPEKHVVKASGELRARIVQTCAVSGDDFPVSISEPIALRFVPATAPHKPGEEIELEAEDLDEIEYEGTSFDIGEAVAQTLALAIDPFAEGPNADAVRKAVGLADEAASGPFAALASLRKHD